MPQLPNKPRRTKALMDQQLTKMFELISHRYTDHELMKMLGMKFRTYYWYKRKLYEKYGALQRQKTEESIAFHQAVLTDRLINVFRQLEIKIMEDRKNMKGEEVAVLAEGIRNMVIDLFRAEAEGFKTINMKLANQLARIQCLDQRTTNRLYEAARRNDNVAGSTDYSDKSSQDSDQTVESRE
jgi:hypothetical protein